MNDLPKPFHYGGLSFTWDLDKEAKVFRERKISFEEAATAVCDVHAIVEEDHGDPTHGRSIGMSKDGNLLLVVDGEIVAGKLYRIITTWKATPAERKRYKAQFGLGRKERSPTTSNRKQFTYSGFLHAHGLPGTTLPRKPLPPRPSGGFRKEMRQRVWDFANAGQESTTGKRIKAFRVLYDLSQSELAALAGMDQGALSRLENDREILGLKRAVALATVLGVESRTLLWRS